MSDIDIIVIIRDLGKKYEIMAQVYRGVEAPIELHVVTEELFEKWYRKFIEPNEIIEI